MRWRGPGALVVLCLATIAGGQAHEPARWHELTVPGGRATLRLLGIPDSRDRATVMVDLIRRLHLSTTSQSDLETVLRRLPTLRDEPMTVPMPLGVDTWTEVIFQRAVSPAALFAAILNDRSARLLFHGLSGLDAATRRWFEDQPELLKRIYADAQAVKAFSLFAPAIRLSNGMIEMPGGAGAARWPALFRVNATDTAPFITQVFTDRGSRTAGLYFLSAFVEPPRQRFLLAADARDGGQRFEQLVARFAECYPAHVNQYPLAVRSPDPALLLLETPLDREGWPAGPRTRELWESVFAADTLDERTPPRDDGVDADAAWIVGRLCAASAEDRRAVFETWLAGHRVFAGVPATQRGAVTVALRVRRLFPALFVALERAGIRDPVAIAALGRHAMQLDRLSGDAAATALRQFQGAIALTLNARHTIDAADMVPLLLSLSRIELSGRRYDGRVGEWLETQWLPLMRRRLAQDAGTADEEVVAQALAGRSPATTPLVHWEGSDYIVDYPAMRLGRLRVARVRQRGATIDRALELRQQARDAAARQDADEVLAAVLASWAYAPHLGAADSAALTGGDPSLRHDFDLAGVHRTRHSLRWRVATVPGDHGAARGALLAMDAALARWLLQRLSRDVIPPPSRLDDNDRASLTLSAALSEPTAIDERQMRSIAEAIARGSAAIERAGRDPLALDRAAAAAAMSPWRRSAIDWMLSEEPAAIVRRFSRTERARIGGLDFQGAWGWGGAAAGIGCLCLRLPPSRVPELILGRPSDGIVGGLAADLMLRVATILDELAMPAALAPAVLSYAMQDFIDNVQPLHPADFDAYADQAESLTTAAVEDYLGAIAALGPLRLTGQ